MNPRPPLGVVGGGLAGLAAAIAAAQRGREVLVWESGEIGRDKVCGEFLSPEAEEDLDALGCGDLASALNPAPLRTVALFGAGGARLDLTLPGRPALGLTRAALETFLARRARDAGAVIHERTPVRGLSPSPSRALEVRTPSSAHAVRALVLSMGKRSTLDAPLGLPRARAERPSFVAIKAYCAKTPLEADVELHVVPGGYVGVNPVEDGRIGVCALLDGAFRPAWPTLLDLATRHPALGRRLTSLGAPTEKPRGLARFGFGAQAIARTCPTTGAPLLFAGDAARLVPSFTGDGMAIALRSGRLASLATFSPDPIRAYTRAFSRAFSARFLVAGALHGLFLRPPFFELLAPLVGRAPRLVEMLYRATRG
ncbi:NAD(P)/FAD-dependent oxidoreductase [Polyangium spumosum]|uniref:FAD-dependent oxidoreductase n=1 Tax=Polyangium spumosum TaxID=889282 RepID=A0A6N7Q1B2_9BACT|nr:FAD-dependent oxidoreductase [Polyangium spumosum]MRG96024.1 FAD-dependent oxidoreductase [Polyangium spumosum]